MLCGFLRPKFGVASGLHLASTTGACVVIPEVYAVGTATEAESAYKGIETGGGISYDAAYDKGDYVVAVGAGHGFYVLGHEATAFIYVRGVAAFLAFIFAFS